jgi:hypothetical protein
MSTKTGQSINGRKDDRWRSQLTIAYLAKITTSRRGRQPRRVGHSRGTTHNDVEGGAATQSCGANSATVRRSLNRISTAPLGASFPTVGSVNPVLTGLALARRLAESPRIAISDRPATLEDQVDDQQSHHHNPAAANRPIR